MKFFASCFAVIFIYGWSSQSICGTPKFFLIEPGISLGQVHLGQSKVISRLTGMSKYLTSREVVVRYGQYDDAIEIMTLSNDFKTSQGIGIQTSAQEFIKLFPSARITCTISRGVSGYTTSKIYDDVASGISFETATHKGRTTQSINSITIHRKDVPVSVFGEIINCSKKVVP